MSSGTHFLGIYLHGYLLCSSLPIRIVPPDFIPALLVAPSPLLSAVIFISFCHF